jgi:hypothetical protein
MNPITNIRMSGDAATSKAIPQNKGSSRFTNSFQKTYGTSGTAMTMLAMRARPPIPYNPRYRISSFVVPGNKPTNREQIARPLATVK